MNVSTMGTAAFALLLVAPFHATAQSRTAVSAGGGFTFAAGESAETHRRGINAGVQVSVPINDRLAVRGAFDYRVLGLDEEARLARDGMELSVFRLGGGFMDGGQRWAFTGLANLQVRLLPDEARFRAFVFAGGGFARTGVRELSTYFIGETEYEPGETENAIAADLGVRAEVRMSPGVSLFGEASYVSLFTSGSATAMLPVTLGLSVRLGARR